MQGFQCFSVDHAQSLPMGNVPFERVQCAPSNVLMSCRIVLAQRCNVHRM